MNAHRSWPPGHLWQGRGFERKAYALSRGLGLIVGSLIAISITSGMLAITIIMLLKGVIRGPLLPLEPTFIALGVEGLILVIGIVMWWYFGSRSWWPFY